MKIKFNALYPVLPVTDIASSISFYRDKLGFGISWVWPNEEEGDQAGIHIGHRGEGREFQITLRDDVSSYGGWLFVNVSNIDEIYEEYLEKGIQVEQELGDFPWGYREFWIRDPDGNQIRFTQELPHSG